MLGTCAGSSVTSKAFPQLPEHHRFDGCEKKLVRVQDTLPSQAKKHEKQVFRLDLDISERVEAVKGIVGFVKKLAALASRKIGDI